MHSQPIVLTIAGSDNTGGAGIQADIKTCCAFGVYAASAITGVTAQNSCGVYGVEPVSLNLLRLQIDSIFEVMRPDAIKTGMLPSPEIISLVAQKISEYNIQNVVVDPVMVATNGDNLVTPGDETLLEFRNSLLPLATIVTPNLAEASAFMAKDVSEMNPLSICERLLNLFKSKSILLKGGHSSGNRSIDYLFDGFNFYEFNEEKVNTQNLHGTGCVLSSAIACGLAKGQNLLQSVEHGKQFVTNAIKKASRLKIIDGPGPLDLFN